MAPVTVLHCYRIFYYSVKCKTDEVKQKVQYLPLKCGTSEVE